MVLEDYPGFANEFNEVISGYLTGTFERAGRRDVGVAFNETEPMIRRWTSAWS